MTQNKDHWRDYQNRWHLLTAPLRPNEEVVATLRAGVGDRTSNMLVLGVTPELVDAFDHVEAVDKSVEMIEKLWAPRSASQQVRQANWLTMGDDFGPYSSVIGDGSPNSLQSLAEIDALLGVVADHLRPHGVFVCRVFERPTQPILQADLVRVIDEGSHGNFHAYKWQIAMSLAAGNGPVVPVVDILEQFNQLHPDRARLAAVTGWDLNVINTIDVYKQSVVALVFPDRAEFDTLLAKHFQSVQWRDSGTYDLADRCPVFVAANV